MDVLHFLSICYKAYEVSPLVSNVADGASLSETFNGIIIESYYGIFCGNIITRFGKIHVSGGGCSLYDPPIEDYIKSRITYKEIIKKEYSYNTGCIGPFYLVTHIDGIPIENDNVEGITIDNYYDYVKRANGEVNQFPAYIEDCVKMGIIKDKMGIIERLLVEPEYYPTAVREVIEGLEYKEYHGMLNKNMYYHIFGLLHRKRLLLF